MTKLNSFKLKWLLVPLVLLSLSIGNVWGGTKTEIYSFATAKNTSNTAYGSTYDVTISSKKWNVPGNQNFSGYVRIGGKNLSKVDRVITGKATIGDTITLITLNHGGKSNNSFTVNSITITVSDKSDFSNTIDTRTISSPSISTSTSGSIDFRPNNVTFWPKDSYYKITFNVSNSNASNNYGLDVKTIKFYKETFGVTYDKNGGTGTMTDGTAYVKGRTVTVKANAFSAPSGKAFDKWNTKSDGSGADKAAGATFALTQDTTLFAIWKSAGTTVTLSPSSPSNGSISLHSGSCSGTTLTGDALSLTTTSSSQTVYVVATPNSGYQVSSVTSKLGDASAVTLSKSGDCYPVTYAQNASGTAVINATFECLTPDITGHPSNGSCVKDGTPSSPLTVTATMATGTMSYAWKECATIDGTYTDATGGSGANTASYTPPTGTIGTKYYKCVVTNSSSGCSTTATSNAASFEVTAASGYCISVYSSSNNGIQSGFSNGGSGHEYTMSFTVPGKDGSNNWPKYWVGENNATASFSGVDSLFANMKFTTCNATLGLAEGATGKLHIWDDNKEAGKNLWIKFEPDGYGLRWGGSDWSGAANTKAFTVDAGDANVYWTDLVTLDGTNNTSWNYYVGLQTASGYVYSGVDNEASDSRGISRTRSVTAMQVSNGTSGSFKATYLNSEPTGSKGKFRIWNNNITDYNFVCHWVPYYEATYDVNGGSAVSTTSSNVGPVCCEGNATARQVTMPAAPSKSDYTFDGWKSSADNVVYAAGEPVSLTQNTTFTAQWTHVPVLTVVPSGLVVAFGDKKVGGTYTETFTVSGQYLQGNITLTPSSGCSGKFSIDKNSITPTDGVVTNEVITVTYTPTTAGNHGGGGVYINVESTNAQLKSVMPTGTGKWEVTFLNGYGDEHSSALYANGGTPSKPGSNPTACDETSTTFMGWTQTAWPDKISQSEIDAKTAANVKVYTSSDALPAVSDNVTYYPVFAREGTGYTNTTVVEDFEKQSASTTYNSTQTYNTSDSNAGIAWSMYFGTVSTNNPIVGSKSAQMRWYSDKTDKYPYIQSTTALDGLQSIKFRSKVGNTNVKVNVLYSTNSGSTWDTIANGASYTTSKAEYSYNVGGTQGTNYLIKIGVNKNSTDPSSGNYAFFVDSVALTYKASGTTYSEYMTSCCDLKAATSLDVTDVTANSVSLSWTAPSPTTGITKLQVVKADGTVMVDNLAANATSATVTGLEECDNYTFKIKSVGSSCSTFSGTVDARPFSGAKTVTYNYHDGTGSPASFTTSCGNTSTTLPTPTRENYRFDGWYDAATSGSLIGAGGASYTPTVDITLHAYWTRVYTVTYNYMGGTSSCADATKYAAGATVTVCTTPPTKSGSSFQGWLGDNSIGTKAAGSTFTMPAANVTLTAQWEDAEYNLTHSGSNYTYPEKTKIKSGDTSPDGLTLNYTCSGTYGFPNTISITGGGKASWTAGTDYTWAVDDSKQSATLVIAETIISDNVTISITMKTRYAVTYNFPVGNISGTTGTLVHYFVNNEAQSLKEVTGVSCLDFDTFEGWTTLADTLQGDKKALKNPVLSGSYTATDAIQLYAMYSHNDATATGYKKITSDVTAGTYLIATDGGVAYKRWNSNSYGDTANVTVSSGTISAQKNAREITVSMDGTTSNFYLYDAGKASDGTTDTKYLSYSGSSNNLTQSATNSADAQKWKLNNSGQIESVNVSGRILQYNSSNPRFACYTNSQTNAYLFKKGGKIYNSVPSCAMYDIAISDTDDGEVTTVPTAGTGVAAATSSVTVNVTPDDCKYLSALSYNDGSDDYDIDISTTPYTFTMPAADVTITATFADKYVTGIAPATNTNRILMQGSSFVGEQIRVTYNSGETVDLAWNNAALSWTGNTTTAIGYHTVTVELDDDCVSPTATHSTSYTVEITDGVPVTYHDGNSTFTRKYELNEVVGVDTITGKLGCSGYAFSGWSETAISTTDDEYVPVHNFAATTARTLYAVYTLEKKQGWMSIEDATCVKSGAEYLYVKVRYSDAFAMSNTASSANSNYMAATVVTSFMGTWRRTSDSKDFQTFTGTPAAALKWQVIKSSNDYYLYNANAAKYLKITSSAIQLTSTPEDDFNFVTGYNDCEVIIQSDNSNYYASGYYSNPNYYFNPYSSEATGHYLITKDSLFTTMPPCAPRSVRFHGNGGTVTGYGGSPTGADVTITEASRDAGIKLPTAAYGVDCNGTPWTFIGWSDEEIDITRVPILTTDLLEDGVTNADHEITSDNEQYWAVYSNTGVPETKYGTITFTQSEFPISYNTTEATLTKTVSGVGDYDFKYYQVCHASGHGIQINHDALSKGYIKNATSLGKITSISFSSFGEGEIGFVQVYVGNTADAITTLLNPSTCLQTVSGVSTYYPNGNYQYVKIQYSNYTAIGNITINFGQGTTVYATTPTCSVITLSGDVKVTSTSGQSMKALTPIAIFGNELAADQSVTLKAYNVSDDTENTHFTFSAITKSGSSIPNQNITVTYNPSGETTDGIENVYFKAVVGDIESNKLNGYGRHLPAKFVIAEKVGDDWYALPNGMGNNYTSWTGAVKLSSVNEGTGVATFYSDTTDQFAYELYRSKALDNAGMAFGSPRKTAGNPATSNIIKANTTASTSTIGLYAQSGWNNGATPTAPYFEFTPSTSDLVDYTLKNTFQNNYLGITSSKWGIGASATVRFLSIDQHAAATITWKNDMISGTDLEKTLATNKAENGVVKLPTTLEDDPVPCAAAGNALTFDGWVTTTWSGYKTTGFTKVNAGDVATSDATYYAVFKTSDNNYFTQCPNTQTVTYTAGTGSGSNVVETVVMLRSSGTAVTLKDVGTSDGQINFTKEGYTFVGWTTSSNYGGEVKFAGNSVTVKPADNDNYGDLTLTAVWIGNLDITGTVRLTASAGEEVATAPATVSFSSADFACAYSLRITYVDVTNSVTYGRTENPTYTSSEFRLHNDDYSSADGGNISVEAVTGSYAQTFVISYVPNGGANTLDHYQLKVEVLWSNNRVIYTETLDLYGRTLPEHFAIATKIGGSWYALPNNMSSPGAHNPILISVTEDANVLNWTAQGPATVGYTMKDYTPSYLYERFAADAVAAADQKCLWASTGNSAGIKNESPTSTDDSYAWKLTPDANFNAYTMSNLANTRKGLKIYSNNWQMSNTGDSLIHFIPLTTVETIDIIAREWKTNGLIYSINDGNVTTAATYKVGNVSETAVGSLTKLSTKGYGLYDVTVCDLSSHYGEVLTLKLTISGNTKYAYVNVPIIVSPTNVQKSYSTKDDAPFSSMKKEESAGYDVVVLNGATLVTDAGTTKACKFHNLYLYPGAGLNNSANGNLDLDYLELRAGLTGYNHLNDTLAVPNVYLGNKISSCTNGANLDMYIDVRHDYALSVPFAVSTADIKYANALRTLDGSAINGTLNSQFLISYYSAEQRATTGKGWVDITSTAMVDSLRPGTGYVVQAKYPSGQPLAVLRFPFTSTKTKPTTWADSGGEFEKPAISISGYGADDPSISDNNKGWNLIANPYSAKIKNHLDGEGFDGKFTVGYLEEEIIDDKWTGKYVYTSKTNAYVTIPNDNYTAYDQKRANAATFWPYRNFFIQASADGTVTFDRTYRAQAPRILRATAEITEPLFVDIDLAHGSNVVTAGLTIDPEATPGYKFGEDQNIFENRSELNYLKVYTVENGHYLVGNTLTPDELAMLIPVEFYAPDNASGYVFRINEASDIDNLESLILFDSQAGTATNLLQEDYPFTVDAAGLVENRFTINVTLKKENNTTTDMDEVDETTDKPLKFFYQQKMFILRNGVIYDATGKKVKEINK